MKKSILTLFSIILLTGCGTVGVDSTAPDGSETPPAPEASVNLTGIWNGILSHELVEGPCPATPTQQGTVLLEQTGSTFTMQFDEGFTCSPAGACDFTGTVEGENFTASNGGIADNEGGQYTTTLAMNAMSDESVQGIGSSTYVHPEMECEWVTSLALTRTVEE